MQLPAAPELFIQSLLQPTKGLVRHAAITYALLFKKLHNPHVSLNVALC